MASIMRALVLSGLAACASSVVVGGACPKATVSVTSSADAAGTPVFGEVATSNGECVNMAAGDVKAIKFCGPGKLTISRMTCERHDYKAIEVKHSTKKYIGTACETISAADTVVDGHLGSITFSC